VREKLKQYKLYDVAGIKLPMVTVADPFAVARLPWKRTASRFEGMTPAANTPQYTPPTPSTPTVTVTEVLVADAWTLVISGAGNLSLAIAERMWIVFIKPFRSPLLARHTSGDRQGDRKFTYRALEQ
jgi:hypothetical protein